MKKIILFTVMMMTVFTLSSCSPKVDLTIDLDRSVFDEENKEVNRSSEMISMSSAFYASLRELSVEISQELQTDHIAASNNETILETVPVDRTLLEERDIYDDYVRYYLNDAINSYTYVDSLIRTNMGYTEGETEIKGDTEMTIFLNDDYVFAQINEKESFQESKRTMHFKLDGDRFIFETYIEVKSDVYTGIEYILYDSDTGYSKILINLEEKEDVTAISTMKLNFKDETFERVFINYEDGLYDVGDIRMYDFKSDSMIGLMIHDNALNSKIVSHYRDSQRSFYYQSHEEDRSATVMYSILDLEGWIEITEIALIGQNDEVLYDSFYMSDDLATEVFDGLRTVEVIDIPLTEEKFTTPFTGLTYVGDYTLRDLENDLDKVDDLAKDYFNEDKFVVYGQTFDTEEDIVDYVKGFIPEIYTKED